MGLFDSMLGLPAGIAQGLGSLEEEENFRPQHKSPLGIGGTLRDVLGGLGDALLIANGADPSYSMKRKAESIGDAMVGYGADPLGAIAGVAGQSPELGQKYLNDYLDNTVAQNKEANRSQEKSFLNGQKFLEMAGSFAGAANPQTWPQLREQLVGMSNKFDMGEFAMSVPPPNATAEELKAWSTTTMKTKDQRFNDYRAERLRQFDEGLDVARDRVGVSRERNAVLERQGEDRISQGDRRLDQGDVREENDEAYREWRKNNAPPSATGGGTPRPASAATPKEGQTQYGVNKAGKKMKRTYSNGKWVVSEL